MLADPVLAPAAPGGPPASASAAALRFAALKNYARVLETAQGDAAAPAALAAYADAAALDGTDVVLWCARGAGSGARARAAARCGVVPWPTRRSSVRRGQRACECAHAAHLRRCTPQPLVRGRHRLGSLALELRRLGVARRALEAGLACNAAHPALLAKLAEACLALGDAAAADDAAARLLRLQPGDERALQIRCVPRRAPAGAACWLAR